MKKMKQIIVSAMVALPLLMSSDAFADHRRGNHRSNHYHGTKRSNHYHGHRTTVVHRHYRPVYRPVYRPYYRPVIAHYHYGFFDPCYDNFHTTGIYWNVGSGGWGFGVQSGW
jgi:hypothetical protein